MTSMPSAPPRLARRLLVAMLPAGLRRDTIVGDLDEEFQERAATSSAREAAAWYWRTSLQVAAYAARDRRRRRIAPQPVKKDTYMSQLIRDVRHGARALVHAPRFTAASLVTLAVGIGASTATFSVANALLFRPLPYQDSARLMWMSSTTPTGGIMSVAWMDFLDWRTRLQSFEAVAGSRSATFTLVGTGETRRLDGRQVTWNFLRLLGVTPALGRDFTADDDRAAPVHPILISDSFWRTTLGQDPQVLDRTLVLDGEPHQVIGVLPRGFKYIADYAVYEPIGVVADMGGFTDRGNHQGLVAIGRLAPGATEAAARQELETLAATLAREHPDTDSGQGAHLESLHSRIIGDLRPALILLTSAVGLLLLIACANVASLLIAHGATRRHEMAVRSALGGGRLRLIRQLLVESLLLSCAGGALGVLVGWGLLHVLIAAAPPALPRLDEIRLDGTTLACALALTTLSGLIFGLLPAIIASAADGQLLVVRAARSGTRSSHQLRRGLLILEVALAVVLLCGTGLMVRTMWRLTTADPGFNSRDLLTLKYAISNADWKAPRILAFHDDVVARIRALPGVVNAGLTISLPIEGLNWGSVFIVGDQPVPERANLPSAAFSPVSPGFLDTIGVRLLAGRMLSEADLDGTPHVAVVNERFAKRFWPNENPIGKRLKQGWPESNTPWREIVGVVNDVKLNGVESDTPLEVYLPLAQSLSRALVLAVRTDGTDRPSASAIRDVISRLASDVPVYDVRTMGEVMDLRVAQQRMSMIVFAIFGGVALLLAAVGLYGVVAQGVADRTPEIGLRVALGATARQVLGPFLRQGALTTAIGIAIGIGAALMLSRFMRDLLFEVAPNDTITLVAVAVGLFVVSMVACALPARRATRVNPTVALRGE